MCHYKHPAEPNASALGNTNGDIRAVMKEHVDFAAEETTSHEMPIVFAGTAAVLRRLDRIPDARRASIASRCVQGDGRGRRWDVGLLSARDAPSNER
jgi:hypothetical protein